MELIILIPELPSLSLGVHFAVLKAEESVGPEGFKPSLVY
jgi:hypothetical protein